MYKLTRIPSVKYSNGDILIIPESVSKKFLKYSSTKISYKPFNR